MANFFLVDHSLISAGSHHADYTKCVAQAAIDLGFSTVVGANTRLSDCESIQQLGNVRRVFRRTTYQRDSYLAGLRHLTRAKPDFSQPTTKPNVFGGLARVFRQRQHQRRREKFIRKFAQDCHRFFDPAIFSSDDHAFFSTVSELELMGLAAFLSNHPRTLQVHWHLQFHFNLFDGRTPDYDNQQHVALAVQSCFDAALARIPCHSIHFYTTSAALADQYNRLGVGNFEVLPYPISPAFADIFANPLGKYRSQPTPTVKRPIRLACPGAIRREKGHLEYLQPLVNQIWDSHLANGEVQIAVQRPYKSKLLLQLPEPTELPDLPVEYLPHPLADLDYIDFIKSSDCGLLFYDSQVYFSRRAGVLGELLSCGKPVVVPAGSWLSDQLQDCIFRYARRLVHKDSLVRNLETSDLEFDRNNVPLPGGVVSFDQVRHPFKMSFQREENETGMSVSFDWHWPELPGVFARVDVEQYDESGNSLSRRRQIVGQSRDDINSTVFFRLLSDACVVDIILRNAFHDSNASIKNVRISTVCLPEKETPIGAVGIIAADQDDLPNCIDELVTHYQHYRSTAESFAQTWSRQHQPTRTIAHLISSESRSRSAA